MSNTTKQPFFVGDHISFSYTNKTITISGSGIVEYIDDKDDRLTVNGYLVEKGACKLERPYSLLWKDLKGRKVAVAYKRSEEEDLASIVGTFNHINQCVRMDAILGDMGMISLKGYTIIPASDFIAANKVKEKQELAVPETIPFDLEKWKTGNYDVVTRSNGSIHNLTYFDYPATTLVAMDDDGDIVQFDIDGRYSKRISGFDLFLIKKQSPKQWVNIDPALLKTEQDAKDFEKLNPEMKAKKII